MFSAILYGRNDAHGYNLHKRGSLSLNCIAEAMTDDDDELIFVDYNTPDELPTFPEAIADTLTAQAKRRLRIIRVRPDYHAQFAGKTRLVALEPHSRNIAIRRANPANRWILSTNTDMIFCPADHQDSLSTVIGGLEDAFYHLPRFEVPEGFWERLDRLDPKAAIAAMRDNGVRYHINEVVYGSYDNVYEGPGDFQLFLRSDLERINGFDERMILGWHADSNMARRMKLLRGEVKTPFPRLTGYHCGHTRQATSLHGGSRTQNDSDLFVRDVVDPVAPEEQWGAPDWEFEEVRLGQNDPYFQAMASAVNSSVQPFTEAAYNESTLFKTTYDTDHVLPHLCDVLFNLPKSQTYFFFGDDGKLLNGVRDFLTKAGRDPHFVVSDVSGMPDLAALGPDWSSAHRPIQDALAQADVVIIQYPRVDQEPERSQERQWWQQRVLSHLARVEREKVKSQRRRVVVVNGIHNSLGGLVEAVLAPSAMPYSTRLRQGFVVDLPSGSDAMADLAEQPIYERLGRITPFAQSDFDLLARAFDSFRSDAPLPGWERLAPEIAAICSAPASARPRFPMTDLEATSFGKRADEAMRTQIDRLVDAPASVGPRAAIGNRLCSSDDWSDPEWLGLALTYFGAEVTSFAERKRWIWERVSLAEAINRHLPLQLLSGLDDDPTPRRLLVVGEAPDLLAAILVHMGYDLTCATTAELLAGRSDHDWPDQINAHWLSLPPAFHRLDASTSAAFDGIVMIKPSLFEKSPSEIDALLAATAPLVRPGSLLFATATVQLNEMLYDGGFSYAEWARLYGAQGPLGSRGFAAVGGIDTRVPLDAAVRFAFQDDAQETVFGLTYGWLNSFNTSALLTARWPEQLAEGTRDRLAWDGPTIDATSVYIPYGDQPFAKTDPPPLAAAADGQSGSADHRDVADADATPLVARVIRRLARLAKP